MIRPTQPLRDEHQELLPHLDHLRQLADAVGETPAPDLARRVGAVHGFLVGHLLPHAQAEEQVLYPVVGRIMGAPEATATMSRDHAEVGALVAELGALKDRLSGAATVDDTTAKGLRRVLYGLYTLVKVHFAKEEEIYLPLLDARLSDAEARAMIAALVAASGGGHGAHRHAHN